MNSPSVLRVLLVEDQPGEAARLRKVLEPARDVHELRSLAEARVRVADGDIDLVLAAARLLEKEGVDPVRQMCVAAPQVPVVVLTGTHDAKWSALCVRLGAAAVVSMGLDDAALGRALQAAIEDHRTEQLLVEIQRSRGLETLVHRVAHHVNNLLGIILGHGSLALAKLPLESPARRHVDEIVAAGEKAAEVSRQMQAGSARGRPDLRPLDVTDVVRGSLVLVEALVPPRLRLETYVPERSAAVLADAGQIRWALLSLVLAALDGVPEEGTLRLTVAEMEHRPDAGAALDPMPPPPGRHVVLELSAAADGVDAAPVRSTQQTRQGLAALVAVARIHGGGLSLAREPRGGQLVKLFLPVAEGAPRSRAV